MARSSFQLRFGVIALLLASLAPAPAAAGEAKPAPVKNATTPAGETTKAGDLGRPGVPAGEATGSRLDPLIRARQEKLARLERHVPGRVERLLGWLEDTTLPDRKLVSAYGAPVRRLRPKLGGQETGAGLSIGAAYEWLRYWHGRLDLSAVGLVSLRKYQTYRLRADLPRLMERRLQLRAEIRYRYRPQEGFFGFGDSSEADETSYRLTDRGIDLSLRYAPERWRWLHLGSRLSYVQPDVGRGLRSGVPSTEELFDPSEIPGLAEQADYMRHEVSIELDRRDRGYAQAGYFYRASLALFNDVELNRFDFHRWEVELLHYLPIVRGYRTVALRFLTTLDAEREGHEVPFYMQQTLGGSNDLRGYSNFRFRDDSRLLLSAEYRFRLWDPLDAALFCDAGKVFEKRNQFNFKDLNVGYGFGLRLHSSDSVLLRIDLARSSEGMSLYLKLNHSF